jgi:hypothetical protein
VDALSERGVESEIVEEVRVVLSGMQADIVHQQHNGHGYHATMVGE